MTNNMEWPFCERTTIEATPLHRVFHAAILSTDNQLLVAA